MAKKLQKEVNKEFDVPVTRTSYSFRTITVKAKNRKEAIRLALEEAGDHEFSEKDADYTAEGAIEK